MLLSQKHRNVLEELRARKFKVHKMHNISSAMAIDQCHEQENNIIKGSGGRVGLTDNPPALRRWMVACPEVARMIAEFENDTRRSHQKYSKHHQHEHHPGVQATFATDVWSLSTVVEETGSQFLEESKDLLVLGNSEECRSTW